MRQGLDPAPGKTEAVRGWPWWPGPRASPAPGWDEGLPRDLSAPFLGPDWGPTGQGQMCHPGEPGSAGGAGKFGSSRPAELRGSGQPAAPRSSRKLEASAPFKFEANFAGAADSSDGRGRNRKQLQERRGDCSSPE